MPIETGITDRPTPKIAIMSSYPKFETKNFNAIANGVWMWNREEALNMYKAGASYTDIAHAVQQPIRAVKAFMAIRTSQDDSIYRERYYALHGNYGDYGDYGDHGDYSDDYVSDKGGV